jgi:hypothetical protein
MILERRQGIDSALDQSGWARPLLFMFYFVLEIKLTSKVKKISYPNPVRISYTKRGRMLSSGF